MGKDPVCGMAVDESPARQTVVYNGQRYYFCSTFCKAAFEQAPLVFLTAPPPLVAPRAGSRPQSQ